MIPAFCTSESVKVDLPWSTVGGGGQHKRQHTFADCDERAEQERTVGNNGNVTDAAGEH